MLHPKNPILIMEAPINIKGLRPESGNAGSSFIHAFLNSFNHSFVNSFIQSINQSIIQSINQSINHSFNHLVIRSFNHSFIHSFIGRGAMKSAQQGGGHPRARARARARARGPPPLPGMRARARALSRLVPLRAASAASICAGEPPLRPSSEHHQHHCARAGTSLRPSGTPPDLRKHRLAPAVRAGCS